jgi:hypothetical protein
MLVLSMLGMTVLAVAPTVEAVTVTNDGAEEPFDFRNCPVVPADVYAIADPLPYAIAPEVGVAVLFVPPNAIATGVVREN